MGVLTKKLKRKDQTRQLEVTIQLLMQKVAEKKLARPETERRND